MASTIKKSDFDNVDPDLYGVDPALIVDGTSFLAHRVGSVKCQGCQLARFYLLSAYAEDER